MSTELSLSFLSLNTTSSFCNILQSPFFFTSLGKSLSAHYSLPYINTMNIIGHCIDPSGTLRVSSFQCGIQPFIPALYLCFLLFVSSFSSLTTYNHPLKNFPCFSFTVSVFRSLFEGLCFYCFLSSFHFHFHFHLIFFSLSY